MKRQLIILAGLLVFTMGTAGAQGQKHEVFGGVGIWSTNTIIDTFSDIIVSGITGGAYTSKNDNYIGDFQLGYKYSPSPRIAVGATFAYAYNNSDAYINNTKNGEFDDNYFTFAAELEYRYVSQPKLVLYGSVGAGATIMKQKYTSDTGKSSDADKTYFNFQVSPIGIKYGNRFGVFGELGFGYKGILSVGIFGRF